jgi:hypothetical protein
MKNNLSSQKMQNQRKKRKVQKMMMLGEREQKLWMPKASSQELDYSMEL